MDSKPYFDEIAGQWDGVRQTFFSDKVREVALARAGVQPGLLAADIGAGTGFLTEALLQRGLRVLAVDQSPAMLEELMRRLGHPDQVECRAGESESLPVADNAVDYVFANMYLHHVESPPSSIREMVRTLKPGGTIVITDADEHTYEFLRTEQHDRWLGFKRDDIRRWFADAGLKGVQVDCVGDNCCPTSRGTGERVAIGIFIAVGRTRDSRRDFPSYRTTISSQKTHAGSPRPGCQAGSGP